MQKGDRSIEFRLGLHGATDTKLNRTQTVAHVYLGLAFRFARNAPNDDSHQGGTAIEEDRTRLALH
jgi:hypothetical protein